MISTAEYSTLVMPSLNRALEADWSATSPDIGGNAIPVWGNDKPLQQSVRILLIFKQWNQRCGV